MRWKYNRGVKFEDEPHTSNNKGVSVIEILVVSAIIAIALSGILGLASFSLKIQTLARQTVEANFLAREALEAVRAFRAGTDWSADGLGILATENPYYPDLQPGATSDIWLLAEGQETMGIYTRHIVFENASRDPLTGNIEETYNPSNDDPDTRKVRSIVYWGEENVEIATYLTSWPR